MILLLAGVALSVIMILAWNVQRRTGQSGWIDAFWSFAIGLVGVAIILLPPTGAPRALLVAGLIGLWSVRLGGHIARRAASSAHDDPRYAYLRETWGAAFATRLFWFLQIQALCALGLVASAYFAAHNPQPIGIKDYCGAALLGIAILGEGVADRQLRRFAADPANKGKVCDHGLWSWSRHPNYFFEWLGWLAYPVIAIDPSGEYWQGWIALIGPVLIYWLLVHASGIPPLEDHMLRSRGDAFRAYMARVSPFFPWPPRKDA